jgi:hypothetical protein
MMFPPAIGDLVMCPDGEGEVIGYAQASKFSRGFYEWGNLLVDGPYVCRLNAGQIFGYCFDQLRRSA